MAFDLKTLRVIKVLFVLITVLSVIGMGFITDSIFNVEKDTSSNIIRILDWQLILGKIAMGFYWSLAIIALVLSFYIYGFNK
jgi:hypothetical protein